MRRQQKKEVLITKEVFSKGALIEKVFFLFFYTIPVAYGINARSLNDYLTHGLTISLYCFLLLAAWLLTTRMRLAIERGRWPPPVSGKNYLIFFAGNAAFSLLLGVLFYSAGVSAVDLYDWVFRLSPMQNRSQFIGLAGAVILALGGLFFWIRLKARFMYGVVEASMGITFAVHRLSAEQQLGLPSDTGFYLAMLTAGIYLVVRGFDNMHQGWREAKDPLASGLLWLGSKPAHGKPPRRLRPGTISPRDPRFKSRIVEIKPK